MADQNIQQAGDQLTQAEPKQPLQTNLPEVTGQQHSSFNNDQPIIVHHQQQETQNITQSASDNNNTYLNQAPVYNQSIPQQNETTVIDNLINPQQMQAPQIQPLLSPDINNDKQQAHNNDSTATVINLPNQKQELQNSPQKSMVTKVKLSDELLFDWFKTTDIINQIAEKAKHSVDTIITALDPGMKEYLYSGGNINIMVISDTDNLISPIRDAFQTAFGRATVVAAKYNPPEASKSFPIKLACGLEEALIVARERIKTLRADASSVPQNQVIVAIQPAIVSSSAEATLVSSSSSDKSATKKDENISPKWFLTYCMVIEDPVLNAIMNSYSQFIPLDDDIHLAAKEGAKFPDDFPGGDRLGFAISIEDLMNIKLKLAPRDLENVEDCKWLREWTGISETQIIRDLSLSVAYLYRRKWNECVN